MLDSSAAIASGSPSRSSSYRVTAWVRCHWARRLVKALLSMWEWNSSGPMTWRSSYPRRRPPTRRGRPRSGWSRRGSRRRHRAGTRCHRSPRRTGRSRRRRRRRRGSPPHGSRTGSAPSGGELGTFLPTGVGGLPGVARPTGAVLAGVRPCAVQGVVAVAQQRLGGVGLGEDVEREQEDLGVPEHVTPVALPRQRVRPDVDRRILRVRRDHQVVDAEPQGAGVGALPTTSQSHSSHRRPHTARLAATTASNPPSRCSATTARHRSCTVPAATVRSREVQMATSLSIRRSRPAHRRAPSPR